MKRTVLKRAIQLKDFTGFSKSVVQFRNVRNKKLSAKLVGKVSSLGCGLLLPFFCVMGQAWMGSQELLPEDMNESGCLLRWIRENETIQ